MLLLFILLTTCKKAEEQAPAQVNPLRDYVNLMDGVVVTHRTGELHLNASALNAIDATPALWTSPPDDPTQQLTLALPTRTRITHLGLSNGGLALFGRAVNKMDFEWSSDGAEFRPFTTITTPRPGADQVFAVPPVDARALRARIAGTFAELGAADVPELLIQGTELEPPLKPSLAGAWKLNNYSANLHDDGNRVLGRVEMQPPMFLDGAWDGRWMRFAWVRGPQWGLGFMAANPEGSKLNGITWFEEAIPQYRGEIWFGEKAGPPSGTADPLNTAFTHLSRRGMFPVYIFRFDEQNRLTPGSMVGMELIRGILQRVPDLKFRLVAHDAEAAGPEAQKLRTDQRIASLRDAATSSGLDLNRLSFASMGATALRGGGELTHYRRMHSRVDLEVIETPRR